MTAAAKRNPCQLRGWLAWRGRDVGTASVMALAMIAAAHGGSAAAGAGPKEKSSAETGVAAPQSGGVAEVPIVLAGRWSGPRYGYARRIPKADNSGGNANMLTYDIVACGNEWCGIAVSDETPCGPIGLRMTGDTAPNRSNAFKGRLELAKGTASYVIEAWYGAPDAGDSSSAARLSLVGDTGTELLMMRRSFPLQAELRRIGDAQCTLEQVTS